MKQTIKTSRVAGQLEKMFRALNSRFFGGELPESRISLKKTAGAYGHFTTGKVWRAGEERRYEINISSASLNQECAFLAGVLVHEMVHEYCAEHGIKDTSNNGVYHNKNFKHIAETHGSEVEHHPKYGWTITSPGLELLDFVEEQGCKISRWSRALTYWMCSEHSPRAATTVQKQKRERKSQEYPRKYICPKCGNSCRATKVINIDMWRLYGKAGCCRISENNSDNGRVRSTGQLYVHF